MSTDGPALRLGRRVVRRLARELDVTLELQPEPAEPAAPAASARTGRGGRSRGREAGTPPRVMFVLGSQRSGTNALRRSISLDPWVMGFNERADDRWYSEWQLKPADELRDDVRGLPCRTVLFKPIVNVQAVPVLEFLEEWADYRVEVAWIYRDPVDVYHSRSKRWPDRDDVDEFVAEWHTVNTPAIEAVDADGRLSLVRYDDLTADPSVYWGLARRLDVRGENLFRDGASKGRARLDAGVVTAIDRACADLVEELDRRRSVLPRPDEPDESAGNGRSAGGTDGAGVPG